MRSEAAAARTLCCEGWAAPGNNFLFKCSDMATAAAALTGEDESGLTEKRGWFGWSWSAPDAGVTGSPGLFGLLLLVLLPLLHWMV